MKVLLLLLMLTAPLYARDNGQYAQVDPEIKNWFNSLKNQHNVPCCDTVDGHRLTEADWDTSGDHYRVRIEGKWEDVPPEAVLTTPNRIGVPIVWYGGSGQSLKIYCFMPGGGV